MRKKNWTTFLQRFVCDFFFAKKWACMCFWQLCKKCWYVNMKFFCSNAIYMNILIFTHICWISKILAYDLLKFVVKWGQDLPQLFSLNMWNVVSAMLFFSWCVLKVLSLVNLCYVLRLVKKIFNYVKCLMVLVFLIYANHCEL